MTPENPMNTRALSFAATLVLACLSVPRVARASDPIAEALYQEGRHAADAHDWALACRKYRESHDREPAPGTLLNLADCEDNRGNLVDALAHFEAASRLFRAGDERIAYARQRGAATERRLPRLTLRLHPASPTGTVIERDGVAVDVGMPTPARVDPGEHAIVVRAPGRTETRTTIVLSEGEARELELAPGVPIPTAQAPSGAAHPSERRPAPEAPASADDSASRPWARQASFVGFSVGAVGVGLGIAGGLVTLGAKGAANSDCPAIGCNGAGVSAASRGRTWSALSTAGFVAGGVGLAAGVGLLFVGPSRAAAGMLSARPLAGGAELGWSASF